MVCGGAVYTLFVLLFISELVNLECWLGGWGFCGKGLCPGVFGRLGRGAGSGLASSELLYGAYLIKQP